MYSKKHLDYHSHPLEIFSYYATGLTYSTKQKHRFKIFYKNSGADVFVLYNTSTTDARSAVKLNRNHTKNPFGVKKSHKPKPVAFL